ncbi:MAG: site-specific DNA-methyltransferase [Candidatus Aquicultor sp.]
MNNKQKLELTWIGKNNSEYDIANIEPRILEERPDLSYGDPNTENMLIHGDNLLALKALLPEYQGKVKCIYIDPPYNTGNAFEHYDDSVEHSTWLSLMKPRLELLRMLMSDDGSIWISIDDDESHYLKILCDEVFGRRNFVANVVWQKKYAASNDARWLSDVHDHILAYAKDKNTWRPNLLERSEELNSKYSNPDNDPRGPWYPTNLSVKTFSEKNYYSITSPAGKEFYPPPTRCWVVSRNKYEEMLADNRIWFGSKGESRPYKKTFLSEVKQGTVPTTLWLHHDAGHNIQAKSEARRLFSDENDLFSTPKPEKLISYILNISSDDHDLVLDSFLGSATTTAVAHKMNRKYIGIEMGEHAYTHAQKRMKKVVDEHDGLKLSDELNWKGGGGFKFYELAPSFIATDEFGNPVIDEYYNDTKLLKAMCKLTNYTFAPSQTEYWKHGKGQGGNHVYVTTQILSMAMVQQIASHLADGESLQIFAKKFEPGCENVDTRITIKKIPQAILKACQYGKKEYLLPIRERAIEEVEVEDFEDGSDDE